MSFFTCFAWLKASPDETEQSWAKFHLEDVFLDVCGFPVFLRSDRGAASTGRLVEELNRLRKITHQFGSAYHLQAHGYIEGRHKPTQAAFKAYTHAFLEDWAMYVKFFSVGIA